MWVPAATEQARVVKWLTAAGHEVVVATTEAEVRHAFATYSFDVALVALDDDADALPMVRSLANMQSTFVLALVPFRVEADLARFYDAGADGDLVLPCSAQLLTARMRAIARLTRRRDGRREPLDIAVRATRDAAAQIEVTTHQLLGLPVTVDDGETPARPFAHAAAVLLMSAPAALEMRIAVAGDLESTRALATHAFGAAASDALVMDLLKELANVLMGTVKTSLSAADLSFSSGVPSALEVDHMRNPPATYTHRQTFILGIEGAQLVVQLALRTKLHRLVLPRDLREGMVLARDLRNERAVLLLPAGTRLSQHLLEKAGPSLPPSAHVEVLVA